MNWNDLAIILAVDRAGGAAMAADTMGVSHATISRRISEVERRLSVTLVDRSGLGWKPTPLCSALAAQAEKMETCHAEATRIATAFSTDMAGQVRISVPTGAVQGFCARALGTFVRENAATSILFQIDDTFADLSGRRADLAVRFTHEPDPDLIGECVVKSQWAFFASPEIAETVERSMADGVLPQVPLLTPSAEGAYPAWAKGIFHPDCACHYVYGFIEKAALAENGFGVALLPTVMGRQSKGLRIIRSLKSPRQNELWILANTDTRSSKRISAVKHHLTRGIKKIAAEFHTL